MTYTEKDSVISLMDLRVTFPIELWIRNEYETEYVYYDTYTEGPTIELYDIKPGKYFILLQNDRSNVTLEIIVKGKGIIGRYFGNYVGDEVLTVDDIKYHFCKGISLDREDNTLRQVLKTAVNHFEQEMRCDVQKKVIKTQPVKILIKGVDYDIEDDPYPLHRTATSLSVLRLKHRPVMSVQRLTYYSNTGVQVKDMIPWMKLDEEQGTIRLFPQVAKGVGVSESQTFGIAGWWWWQGMPEIDYGHALQCDYTVGMDVNRLPEIYYQIIGMMASIYLLIPVSEETRVGWTSTSFSIDGISQAISANPGLFYADRINAYKEAIKDYFAKNRYRRGYVIAHV